MPVSLQINLAPFDHRHAEHLLRHQIDTFSDGIDEIILTYDIGWGKPRTPKWHDAHLKMLNVALTTARSDSRVQICPVEYDNASICEVSNYFSAHVGKLLPLYDFRGAPFYQYFHGLHEARNDLVLHMDSDMFFGGSGKGWLAEALDILDSDPCVMTVSPHPGPPHPDGKLRGQATKPYRSTPRSYAFNTVSTRVFLMDRRSLMHRIDARMPGLLQTAWAIWHGFPAMQTAEHCIGETMRRGWRQRVDTLGRGAGLWSLHPPHRSEAFYSGLPGIIARVKVEDVPEDQLGCYDMVPSFFDWGEKVRSYK